MFTSVAANGSSDVWVVEANGGTPRRLTSGPGNSVAPSFSHDGKWVYFCARTGRPEIFRVPFAGGAAIRVTRNGGDFSQESPHGRTPYYTKDHLYVFKMTSKSCAMVFTMSHRCTETDFAAESFGSSISPGGGNA